MGINYYLKRKIDSRGETETLHIGKNSYGWNFLLAVYPEKNINSLEDWKALLKDPDNTIIDEYNDILIDPDHLINLIENKNKPVTSLSQKEINENNYDLGINNLIKHSGENIKDNNTGKTYDIYNGHQFF